MSNVVSLPRAEGRLSLVADNSKSPIMFHAYERELFYLGKEQRYNVQTHKALVRMDEATQQPVTLNVVGKSYKVVQNEELFDQVHAGMRTALTEGEVRGAEIIDRVSHGGARCFREYRFRNISVTSPENDTIGFRVIVENGFGTGAIKIHAGAIDFFCTNGMILGDYVSMYAKHTSGVQIIRFKEHVELAVQMFWKHKDLWGQLRSKVLTDDALVQKWLQEQFSKPVGNKIYLQYLVEKQVRGGQNAWALHCAMTRYASHSNEFPVRNTGNDHLAYTMLQREHKVRNITSGGVDAFISLAA